MTLHAGESPLAGSSEHTISNLPLTVADFEYSYKFPIRTRKIAIKPRSTSATLKISFNSGESGSNYITVPPGGWWHDLIGIDNATIYIQSATAGTVAEIESWR